MIEGTKPSPTVAELYSFVKKTLTDAEFGFDPFDQNNYLILPFSGEVLNYEIVVFVGEGYVTMVAELPIVIPSASVNDVLVTLNDKTVSVPLGNFQLNRNRWVVQFKLGLVANEMPGAAVVVEALITVSRAISGIAGTVLRLVTPA